MPTHKQIIDEAAKLVAEGVSVTLPVEGRSMLPFIIGGRDSVILQKPGLLRSGDVVLAWVDGCRYVIHRIISINGEHITLMGDGNLVATEQCTVCCVKALATHIVKARGKTYYIYSDGGRLLSKLWFRLRPVRKYLLPIIVKLLRLKKRN